MGLRYRRSIKIAPGIRLNINKNSVGISAGVKGLRYTVNSKGQTTKTVGIPGTGLYYAETSRGQKSAGAGRATAMDALPQTAPARSSGKNKQKPPKEKKQKPPKVYADIRFSDPADWGNIFWGVVFLVAAFFASGFSWPLAIVVALLAVWFFVSYALYKKHPDDPKYITPEQLERWRGLLGVDKGNAYDLGKQSLPILVSLKEAVSQAVQDQDGPAVLEMQQKLVDFSEFVVIRGDNPADDLARYASIYGSET